MKQVWAFFSLALILSCSNKENNYDASGTFESDEVIVSSEQNGQLLSFNVHEGDSLTKGQSVGFIDSTNLVLQKQQVQANNSSPQSQHLYYAASPAPFSCSCYHGSVFSFTG